MSPRPRSSLFRRLVVAYSLVLLALWLAAIALVTISMVLSGDRHIERGERTMARQIMAGVRALSVEPARVAAAIEEIERLEAEQVREAGAGKPAHIQVWQAGRVLYGSTGLPLQAPTSSSTRLAPLSPGSAWMVWVETDRETGLAVRIAAEDARAITIFTSDFGFLLLPLAVCTPLLLLPAWWATRTGLRPLAAVGAQIEARHVSDLSPLAPSPFRELAPIVDAVNSLMGRLDQRLRREQEFLVDAAHQLETPLAVIQVNADNLAASDDAAHVESARAGLAIGVARAAHAVHQLIAMTRTGQDSGRAEYGPLDLAELLRERIAHCTVLAAARAVEFEVVAPAACMLALERESITALVDNLCDNAIKYSPQGSSVVVTLAQIDGRWSLRIADRGPGIAAEYRGRVFERFFRVPGQDEPGSGLGLAIVERAAHRNGAVVALQNGPDGIGLHVIVSFAAGPDAGKST